MELQSPPGPCWGLQVESWLYAFFHCIIHPSYRGVQSSIASMLFSSSIHSQKLFHTNGRNRQSVCIDNGWTTPDAIWWPCWGLQVESWLYAYYPWLHTTIGMVYFAVFSLKPTVALIYINWLSTGYQLVINW